MADNLGFGGSNPYVMNQAKALQASSNQNLQQNVLPGIGQGAQASGMYGSSRQGIAQGQAIANAQTGLDSATANLYSNAYNQDQNAELQRQQMANQMGIASMQNATQLKSIENQYALGNKTADQNYGLGMGNLGLGYQNSNQQYQLGLGNLGVANKQADNSFTLGQGQLANQNQANSNSYNLGLRSNDLGFASLDANIAQNNFGNQLAGANFGMNVYDRMNGYGQQDIQNSTNMQNTPMNYFNQFNNNANAIAGQGGTSTNSQTNPGNPYIGALGGLQLGSQLFGSK